MSAAIITIKQINEQYCIFGRDNQFIEASEQAHHAVARTLTSGDLFNLTLHLRDRNIRQISIYEQAPTDSYLIEFDESSTISKENNVFYYQDKQYADEKELLKLILQHDLNVRLYTITDTETNMSVSVVSEYDLCFFISGVEVSAIHAALEVARQAFKQQPYETFTTDIEDKYQLTVHHESVF